MVNISYNQYVLIIQEFKGVGFGGCFNLRFPTLYLACILELTQQSIGGR